MRERLRTIAREGEIHETSRGVGTHNLNVLQPLNQSFSSHVLIQPTIFKTAPPSCRFGNTTLTQQPFHQSCTASLKCTKGSMQNHFCPLGRCRVRVSPQSDFFSQLIISLRSPLTFIQTDVPEVTTLQQACTINRYKIVISIRPCVDLSFKLL